MKPNAVSKLRTPNSDRPKGARNKVFRAEKLRRRQEAEARNAITAALSPQERLKRLDQAFGKGKGAQRERERLLDRINNPPKAVQAATGDASKATNLPKAVRSKTQQRKIFAQTGVRLPLLADLEKNVSKNSAAA